MSWWSWRWYDLINWSWIGLMWALYARVWFHLSSNFLRRDPPATQSNMILKSCVVTHLSLSHLVFCPYSLTCTSFRSRVLTNDRGSHRQRPKKGGFPQPIPTKRIHGGTVEDSPMSIPFSLLQIALWPRHFFSIYSPNQEEAHWWVICLLVHLNSQCIQAFKAYFMGGSKYCVLLLTQAVTCMAIPGVYNEERRGKGEEAQKALALN